jgi:hypothetical protein
MFVRSTVQTDTGALEIRSTSDFLFDSRDKQGDGTRERRKDPSAYVKRMSERSFRHADSVTRFQETIDSAALNIGTVRP